MHVGPGVQIGNGVKIQNNVSIYSGVFLEDDVFCGPSVVFTNVKNPRSEINQKHNFLKTMVKRGATVGVMPQSCVALNSVPIVSSEQVRWFPCCTALVSFWRSSVIQWVTNMDRVRSITDV